jgi:hypothetical protein
MNNIAVKAGKQSAGTEAGNDTPVKEMDILDHFEKIVKISRKMDIDKCLSTEKGKKHFDYVTGKLGISPIQAVLFSNILEICCDNTIKLDKLIAKTVKCGKIRMLKYIGEFKELEKKKLIRCKMDYGEISYRIPREVIESLQKYNEYKPEKTDNLTISEFFLAASKLYKIRENKEYSYDTLKCEVFDLINQNMHLILCREIMNFDLGENDVILLILFCLSFWMNNDDIIMSHDIEFLYEGAGSLDGLVKFELTNGEHPLMQRGYIEYTNNNGFANKESWRLTYTAKKEFLSELKFNMNYNKNLLLSKKITHKKMYYNRKEGAAIEKLTSLLQEENYQKIVNRLEGKNMRKGFTCLFSGGPGTGKTETVYQIALETKRNIFLVDISKTKSMWYGESEKIIKEIFDTYRSAVEKSEIAPILLFNEADAVIGKRRELNSSGRAVDQTENTIQNILLQEMENLSGILIATTNLTQNMDSAFERRFLYKITFEKPSAESRKHIWNILLPDLPEDNAVELSGKFELSGGQIENIARKIEVDSIISGGDLSMNTLVQYCKDENQNSFNASKRIGFENE